MSRRVFAVRWKIWLFCAFFLPLTIGLGFWQLDRAAYKSSRSAIIEQQMRLPPTNLRDASPLRAFRPYTFSARYGDKHFLLDNRLREGKVGYEVLTPAQLQTGAWVLVNRGWVSASMRREVLPSIQDVSGAQRIEGYFYAPDGRVPVLDQRSEPPTWPRRIQAVDWDRLEDAIAGTFHRHEVFRLTDSEQAGAYQVGWPLQTGDAAKHKAYAVQWFAMATALVILTIWATWRLGKSGKASFEHEQNAQ